MKKNCNNNKYVNPDYYSVVIVQTLQERDNIPCKLRQNGMIVTVVEENYIQYQIKILDTNTGICSNDNWEIVASEDTIFTKGPKGEIGKPFQYEDFTTEQLLLLTGPKGIPGVKGENGEIKNISIKVNRSMHLILQVSANSKLELELDNRGHLLLI